MTDQSKKIIAQCERLKINPARMPPQWNLNQEMFKAAEIAPIITQLLEANERLAETLKLIEDSSPANGETGFSCPFCDMGGEEAFVSHDTEHRGGCPVPKVEQALTANADAMKRLSEGDL